MKEKNKMNDKHTLNSANDMQKKRREAETDCFAYYRGATGTYCKVLNEMICKKRKCSFYKKAGTLCESCNPKSYHQCQSCEDARTHFKPRNE